MTGGKETREILFRGKRVDNGEWKVGDLLRSKDYLSDIKQSFIFTDAVAYPANEFCGYEEVDPDTVGRYTGLIDRNGVKIFEGDVVHVYDTTLHCCNRFHDFYGYVDFSDGSFCIVSEGSKHYRWMDYEIEIIGNIFDNESELLERVGEK